MKSSRNLSLWFALLAWFAAIGLGGDLLMRYAGQAGVAACPLPDWPSQSAIPAPSDQPVLVMFLHPHCPCSRASVSNLARMAVFLNGRMHMHVYFVLAANQEEAWAQTDTWSSANRIPGVEIRTDPGGLEARRFGARTSGQTFVHDARGRLVFFGGITGARGHEGDNDGEKAIRSFLITGNAPIGDWPVFGCPLLDDDVVAERKGPSEVGE